MKLYIFELFGKEIYRRVEEVEETPRTYRNKDRRFNKSDEGIAKYERVFLTVDDLGLAKAAFGREINSRIDYLRRQIECMDDHIRAEQKRLEELEEIDKSEGQL